MAVAGLRIGTSPACDVPASGMVYGLRYLAQQIKGGTGVLTAGRGRVLGLCREADVDGGRRRRNGVGEEAAAGVSGPLDPSRRCAAVLGSRNEGQRSHGIAGGEQLLGVGLTGDDGFGVNSGACRASDRGQWPR
jgi:hypothetical protein